MIWASVLMFLMQAIQLIFPATFYINYIQLRMMHDTTSQLEALNNKFSVKYSSMFIHNWDDFRNTQLFVIDLSTV